MIDEAQKKINAANSIFSNPNIKVCRVYAVNKKNIINFYSFLL